MRLMILTLALGPVIGLAACAETPKQTASRLQGEERDRMELDRELIGLVAGQPQTCLPTFQRRDSRSFGDTLVYRSGRVRYVTQVPGCRSIGENNILVTVSTGGQLCRGDIATTVDNSSRIQNGSCSFGDFTPYRPPS